MPAVLDEAEAHMLRASEARRVSWLSFRFTPDWELVAAELRLAAACFEAAGKNNRLVEAIQLGTEAEVRLNRLVEAAKLQEKLACLLLKDKTLSSKRSNSKGFLSTTAAAYEEALDALQQAVTYYRLSGNYDAAATLLCRIAEKREGERGCRAIDAAARAYEEAIALSLDAQRPICASEVCRNYISMLVRRGRLQEAVSITLKRAGYLLELDRIPGVHKALLTAIVLLLALGKPSEASSILTCPEALYSCFMGTPPFAAGTGVINAFKQRDGPALKRCLNLPVFRYLLPPVVIISRQLMAQATAWSSERTDTLKELSDAEGMEREIDRVLRKATEQ